jgi:hypothetical protein
MSSWALWLKSPLPKQDQALKFFDLNSIICPLLLATTSLPFLVASSPMSFNFFDVDQVHKNL